MNITITDDYIIVDMIKYIEKLLESARGAIRHCASPGSDKLFDVDENSKPLDEDCKSYFHSGRKITLPCEAMQIGNTNRCEFPIFKSNGADRRGFEETESSPGILE